MRKFYIKAENIILIMMFFVGFVRFPYSSLYNSLKIGMVAIILLYIFANIRYIKREYYLLDILVFVLGGWIFISGCINNNLVSTSSPFAGALLFWLVLMCSFLGMQIINEKKGAAYIIKMFTYSATFLAIIVDIQAVTLIGAVRYGATIAYYVGSKFAVMYLHIILGAFLLLYLEDNKRKKSVIGFYFIYVIFIALKVDCVTGIVGSLFMISFIYVIRKYPKVVSKPAFALGAELLAFSYVYVGVYVMSNEIVLYIIENYMGGAGTMISRINIFESVLKLIPLSPIWGFGYATSWELGLRLGGFGDTQNSLLEWVWQAGIPSAVMICIIIIVAFRIVNQNYIKSKTVCVYSLALFYTYVFLGSIEILMELPFFSVLSLAVILSDKISVNEENGNV